MLSRPRTQVSDPILILVNYDLTIEQMKVAGEYDWSSVYITSKNFPINRQGQEWTELFLVHFNRSISSADAIREMGELGFQPAELPHLLALGACRKELQRMFAIVALGSIWEDPDGRKNATVLWSYVYSSPDDRRVSIIGIENAHSSEYRFLAVRKKRS